MGESYSSSECSGYSSGHCPLPSYSRGLEPSRAYGGSPGSGSSPLYEKARLAVGGDYDLEMKANRCVL